MKLSAVIFLVVIIFTTNSYAQRRVGVDLETNADNDVESDNQVEQIVGDFDIPDDPIEGFIHLGSEVMRNVMADEVRWLSPADILHWGMNKIC